MISILILFFFLKGPQFLFNKFNGNLAYVADQIGLFTIAFALAYFWLKGKKVFSLTMGLILLVSLVVVLAHYNSFYRAIFDEWSNIISGLNDIHYRGIDPIRTGFYITRDRYPWAPFVLFYEVFGIYGTHSNFLMSSFGILMIAFAALSGAWLAGVISGKKTAALLAGLLIGISPNSFASLPWPSSLEGDSLAIVMVVITVGIWIIARRRKSSWGILLSYLFLAASLKGGGSVRTITAGLLLIATDLTIFLKDFKKKWIFDWIGIFAIEVIYYVLTEAVHMTARTESVPLVVRGAQIMELTTKSFIPPTILTKIIENLIYHNDKVIWVVVIGVVIFILGSIFALMSIFKFNGKYKLFAWGWIWFYLTASYAPWFAEGYGATLNSIHDRAVFSLLEQAGFKYAYLPLVALHVCIAIALATLIAKKSTRKIFIILTLALILFRGVEFLQLDYRWRKEKGEIDSEWQQALFKLVPQNLEFQDKPYMVMLVDGKHNPIAASMGSVQLGLYHNGSVLIYSNAVEFFQTMTARQVPFEKIFALGWDSGNLKEIDMTNIFRDWLKNRDSFNLQITNFEDWKSSKFSNGFVFPESISFGDVVQGKDSAFESSELNILLPATDTMNMKVYADIESTLKNVGIKGAYLNIAFVCNSDHGKKIRAELVDSQQTEEDQLNDSRIKISVTKTGNVMLNSPIKCFGPVLKKIVISGSPYIKFKLTKIELGFPYPNISSF
jgi:hypothetical protein